jgi:membrane protein YqaA with SNARE-associated domain
LLARITAFLVALGPWGILAVAIIDAGVPIPNGLDFLVILLSVKEPAWAPLWTALAVLGSSTGNFVLFYLSRKGGERLLKAEAPAGYRQRFRVWFNRYGLVTVFIPALIPIPMPLKFFVVSSGMLGIRWVYFLGTLLLARSLRYGAESYLGVQMGEHSTQYLAAHTRQLGAFAALLFIALYLLIRLSDRRAAARASREQAARPGRH